MANIKFSYLYRDGANYKTYNDIILENPDSVDITKLEKLIRSKLIDDLWFYVDQWLLPDLHFNQWDDELDHTFHEFEDLTYTSQPVNTSVSLMVFMEAVKIVTINK